MNKKGFTLIELISTFALASVIIVLLMNVVILIKDVYNQNNIKTELMIEQSNLSKMMNEEFNKQLVGYEWCNDSIFCYNFNFSDGSSSKLRIEDNKITFNKYVYKMDKGVEIVDPSISREYVDINDELNTYNFIRIKIPIVSKLYPNKDFGIDIVFKGTTPITDDDTEEDSGEDLGGDTEEEPICTLASDSSLIKGQIGSKYNCQVNDEEIHTFYLLSHNNDGTSNLIMERNICSNGTYATSTNTCFVAWNTSNYCANGPVTVMNYLHTATKEWSKVPNIQMDYEDENIQKSTYSKGNSYAYGTIKTVGDITTITKKDGTEQVTYTNLKSRMPRYDEVHGNSLCKGYEENNNKSGSCPLWLVNHLDTDRSTSAYYQSNAISLSNINGYWLLPSSSNYYNGAWAIINNGYLEIMYVNDASNQGVRPVITVDLNPGE